MKKFFSKNVQEMTVKESFVYIIISMLLCVVVVPIMWVTAALFDGIDGDDVKRWFRNRWLDVKALWSVMFDR